MTFLDDYQALYKLQGVSLASQMLDSVSAKLLKHTGVGQLIMSVCKMPSTLYLLNPKCKRITHLSFLYRFPPARNSLYSVHSRCYMTT